MDGNNSKFIAINIPKNLHKQFKALCVKEETSMVKEVIRMIEEFINDKNKENNK